MRIDRPAHDFERVGPDVLAAHFDGGNTGVAGLQYAGGGAIAEQRGGDDVRLGEFVEPECQRADLDRHQQYDTARTGLCQTRRDRQAADAAGAAKTEHRHTLDVRAKAHAPGDMRFKTRSGDARR